MDKRHSGYERLQPIYRRIKLLGESVRASGVESSLNVSLRTVNAFLWGFRELVTSVSPMSQKQKEERLRELLIVCKGSRNKESLQRAVMEIPMLAVPGDEASVDALSGLLDHEDRHVWVNALHSIGLIGGNKAKAVLEKQRESKNPERRQSAIETLSLCEVAEIARALNTLARELDDETRRLRRLVRTQVFISYSHEDKKWLEGLKRMLAPSIRDEGLDMWDDTRIKSGGKWKEEIRDALQRAKVAVLLVSDYFLESDFIAKKELPPILEAAENKELRILWVYVSYCMYDVTAIKNYQATQRPLTPLDKLRVPQRKEVLKEIGKQIIEAAR